MKTYKYTVGTAALALLLTGGAMTASAYQGDYTQEGPNCTEDRHEAMEEAFENLDYGVWYDLMGDKGRVAEVITEDNFDLFVEAHELGKEGDVSGADKIRTELGLRTSDGERTGAGHRGGNGEGQGDNAGQGKGQSRTNN